MTTTTTTPNLSAELTAALRVLEAAAKTVRKLADAEETRWLRASGDAADVGDEDASDRLQELANRASSAVVGVDDLMGSLVFALTGRDA